MIRAHFPFVSFIVCCMIVPSALAQDPKPGAKISFSVTRFDPQDRPSPEFIVKNGAQDVTVKVPLTYIEGPFKATLRDDKFLDFFEDSAKAPALSTVIPPEMRKDLLLVFIPDKKGFKILRIHAPKSEIKGGDYYVTNATSSEIAIKYGVAKPVVVVPGKSALLRDSPANRSPTLPVIINQKDGDRWKLVSSENWPRDVRFRNFLFLYISARDHHIAIHGISERLD